MNDEEFSVEGGNRVVGYAVIVFIGVIVAVIWALASAA